MILRIASPMRICSPECMQYIFINLENIHQHLRFTYFRLNEMKSFVLQMIAQTSEERIKQTNVQIKEEIFSYIFQLKSYTINYSKSNAFNKVFFIPLSMSRLFADVSTADI